MNLTLNSIVALALLGVTGCSTIMTGGTKSVNFRSTPDGAHLVIKDEKGIAVFEGTTPTVVSLKTGKAYFANKRYTIEFSKEGFAPAATKMNGRVSGWYAGNLLFGGLVGILIVDPLTGAMYTLPKEHTISLVPNGQVQPANGHTQVENPAQTHMRVVDLQDVPQDLRALLVRVN